MGPDGLFLSNRRDIDVSFILNKRQRIYSRNGFRVSELGSAVHGQTSSSAAESVSLGTEFPSVALFAIDLSLMFGAVRAVQSLLAEAAVEAGLVPLAPSGDHLLRCVHRLPALRALSTLWSFERHRGTGLAVFPGLSIEPRVRLKASSL